MANCEDIKDKNSQEYKDCVENNKVPKVETPATIGSVGKLEGVDAVGQVSDTSRFRNTLGIKLGTELVNEVTTRNTTNSWIPTINNR